MYSFGSWENRYDDWKTTPPDDDEPVMLDEFENEIYEGEKYVDLNGWILSMDSLEDVSASPDDYAEFDEIECCDCGEKFIDAFSGKIYLINGDWFCEECVENCIQKASKEE